MKYSELRKLAEEWERSARRSQIHAAQAERELAEFKAITLTTHVGQPRGEVCDFAAQSTIDQRLLATCGREELRSLRDHQKAKTVESIVRALIGSRFVWEEDHDTVGAFGRTQVTTYRIRLVSQ